MFPGLYPALNEEYVTDILEPFAPKDTHNQVTPIEFFAVNPDLMLLVFNSTDEDGQNTSFVSVQHDGFLATMDDVARVVEQEVGEITTFLPLLSCSKKPGQNLDIQDVQAQIGEDRYVLFVQAQPKKKSFWTTKIELEPHEDFSEKIGHLSDAAQDNIRQSIVDLSERAGIKTTKESTVNRTLHTIVVYVAPDDSVEFFIF